MSMEKRIELIQRIQELRSSSILVYFTGDRPRAASQIAEDAVTFIYKHLLKMKGKLPESKKLDLFLYTRGGDVSVPWRIVTIIREFYEEFCVLIPFRCHSAGTMIALGADRVVMGRKAELSPIDPKLVKSVTGEGSVTPSEISVEDVSSYISFMRERANITDQAALAQVVSQLANNLTPLTLGTVNRQYSHIRLVARKLLGSRKEKVDEDRISSIIEALTEKMYSHGHAIGRKEAKELGLPIEEPNDELEKLIWDLYREYEDILELTSPIDPEYVLTKEKKEELTMENVPLAIIECNVKTDIFEADIAFRRKRQVPANPQINVNLNLGLPPGFDPASLPQNFQTILQQLMSEMANAIPGKVQQELIRQSPSIGIEGKIYHNLWKDKRP